MEGERGGIRRETMIEIARLAGRHRYGLNWPYFFDPWCRLDLEDEEAFWRRLHDASERRQREAA